jgi:membrane fusion protein (multidrug efflux system)
MPATTIRQTKVWLPALLGLALIAIVIFRVVQASIPEEPMPSVEEIREAQGVSVMVAEVTRGPLEVWRQHSGTAAGRQEGVLRSRSDDPVAEVLVSVGERVRDGQVLVRMAGDGIEARRRQAEAAAAQAQRVLDRMRPLHEAGAISYQEWDQVTTQLELALADLAAVRAMVELTSPLTGTVTEVLARPGLVTRGGDPLVRVSDLGEVLVSLHVSPADAAELRPGQAARAANGAMGRVQRVALQADPMSRLVEVTVAFPPEAGLVAGTYATIEVRVAAREDAVKAPATGIRDGVAWVVGADNRVSRRVVRAGLQGNGLVEVLEGLEAGERVVVDGAALLSEGAMVRVVAGREG